MWRWGCLVLVVVGGVNQGCLLGGACGVVVWIDSKDGSLLCVGGWCILLVCSGVWGVSPGWLISGVGVCCTV